MQKIWDRLKGYRTIAFNVIALLPPILDALSMVDVHGLLGDKGYAVYSVIVLIANIYLRSITTTPVGQK